MFSSPGLLHLNPYSASPNEKSFLANRSFFWHECACACCLTTGSMLAFGPAGLFEYFSFVLASNILHFETMCMLSWGNSCIICIRHLPFLQIGQQSKSFKWNTHVCPFKSINTCLLNGENICPSNGSCACPSNAPVLGVKIWNTVCWIFWRWSQG